MAFALKSAAFEHGQSIPARYTCEGDDVSPPLAWSGAPEGQGTQFVDPTASGHYHVCLYGGSPVSVEFDAGVPPGAGWKSHRASWIRRSTWSSAVLEKQLF